MRRHIPTLADAFRFYGAFVWFVTGLSAALMTTMSLGVGALEGIQPALVLCIPLLFTLLGGGALGALYRRVGDGLHAHRPWARYAALVLSVLVLGDLPFGLPLGLLGLGVLLDGEAAAAFEPTASTPVARETRAARRVQAARARQVA